MKTPQYLVKAPIDSPNRSGFSLPFENHLTGECGTLYPALMKEMIPNETVSLDVLHDIELPPMVSNFRGRVDMIYEAFFVPYSLLWGGWEEFAMHPTHNPIYPKDTPVEWKPTSIPRLRFPAGSGIGTIQLGNYLGFRGFTSFSANYDTSILPWLCYHRIYDDWYRNTMVQTKLFGPPRSNFSGVSTDNVVSYFPYTSQVNPSVGDSNIVNTFTFTANDLQTDFFDGVNITELRQRNWNLDYFSSATPQPQAGNSTSIEFSVDDDGNGSFSIAALRTGNAIQQWKERNNIVGYDYYSQMHAQHGIYPRMRKLDKCIYLGRVVDPVYNRSVFQTSPTATGSPNPFADIAGFGVGAKYGSSQANGRGNLFENFTTFDYGYLVVMVSMRPHAYYSTGLDPKTKTQFIGDIAFPLLSGVGDQPIYADELDLTSSNVFGWTDRYAQHKCYVDEVHGEFSAGGSLAPFVLQRNIGANPVIGSDFLEIPKDFMEQVRQVDKSIITADWFGTIYFNFNKISTLPQYSVPTLANIKHTHTEFVRKGGQKL